MRSDLRHYANNGVAVGPDATNITRYLSDVSKQEMVDAATERHLFIHYKKTKDPQAREKILYSALRFVIKLAKGYSRNGVTTEDLISAGNVGLLRAFERFDYKRNTRFLSYATSWVLLEMRNELYNAGIVSMPLWRQKVLRKLRKANARLEAQNGCGASVDDLCKATELSPARVRQLQGSQNLCTVLFCEFGDANNGDGRTYLQPKQQKETLPVINEECHAILDHLIRLLPTVKEQFVVRAYFGWISDPMSLRQIANVLGVSSERVRQVKTDALRRLRKVLSYRLDIMSTNDMLD